MSQPWEPCLGTELTRYVHRYKEEIGFVRVNSSNGTSQQIFMNGNLGRKQVVGAALVAKPIVIELRW